MLLKAPDRIKNKLFQYSSNDEVFEGKIELVVLVGQNIENVKFEVQNVGAEYEDLGYGFGIITTEVKDISKIGEITGIQYIEFPKTLYTDFAPSNKASCIEEVWKINKLSGRGILVGFIDSGIDYTHPAFMDEEGGTRIEYIFDIGKQKIWNKEDINNALKLENPYEIVSQRDELGHGTHVAGIACGGGKINKRYYGAAYESSIAMVKMTREGKINFAKSTQLMRGIKFLIDKSREMRVPLVINLSFSTNDGAHDGNSLLELYIKTINSLEKITFIAAAGNEGDRGHHVGEFMKDKQVIIYNIASDERSLILQFYKDFIDDISIEIKNPQGKSTGILKIDRSYTSGFIGDDRYYLYNQGSTPFNINGEVLLSFVSEEEYLTSGVWTLTIYSKGYRGTRYDIWMPISEGLNPRTKFLSPNPYNTLGIPATVSNAISVGSYDYVTNNISSFSGRGKLISEFIKPDIAAPGQDIESAVPGGGFDSLSGTSMAAPQAAGAAALLMQWGFVLGKDPYMYGERLKYFLLKGAKRERVDVEYPNPLWGYGSLCVRNSLEVWKEERSRAVKNKIRKCRGCWNGENYLSEEYLNFIVEYDGDLEGALLKIDYACGFILDDKYAVIAVKSEKSQQLLKDVKEIIYKEFTALYTLNELSPIDTANISKFHDNPFLTLRGTGVVVGIIDTGIDYLNKEFIYEDDTTRILSIWDQTSSGGTKPEDLDFGSEFTAEQINEAIKLSKNNGDPYSIVDTKDEIGHGTSMAGIIGARGRNGVTGAAPDCDFMVVKLKQAKKNMMKKEGVSEEEVPIYDSTDIILAIKYLVTKFIKMTEPMVIYIPLGTNMGAHDGSSIVERYIDEISKARGGVVVTGTGNQGESETHSSGSIAEGEMKTIEVKVDPLEKNLDFQIWCNKPDKVSFGMVSPSGEVIEKIPAKLQETEEIKFVFEGSSVFVTYFYPEEKTGDELIKVRIRNVRGGIWQLRLYGDRIVNGKYDIWLPQRQLLKEETKFLDPSPYITLTVPSASRRIICSSVYNQNNDTVVAFSGRGYTRDGRIKPDVAAGGINVTTTAVGGGTTVVSGSSAASAVLAGAVALMLQWGIIDGNDPTLYSTKIQAYLIRGTRTRDGDVHPNTQWGYGILDLQGVFENIRGLHRGSEQEMVIRIPEGYFNS